MTHLYCPVMHYNCMDKASPKYPCTSTWGVLLSSDMKWSSHIEVTCSKAKRVLGLLYRRFYGLADCRTIIQLYLSIVSETTSGICQLLMGSSHIKGYHFIGKRAKVCMQNCYTKHWTGEYQQLLETCAIPSLAERRAQLKLYVSCTTFCMVTVTFLKMFLCVLQINILLDPITWFLVSLLHTLTHLYPILFLCGTICLKSKYLLPLYKLLRNYFNYHCSCYLLHLLSIIVVGMLHISIVFRYCISIAQSKNKLFLFCRV